MNKKDILVIDIECWSDYDIQKEHDKYIEDAKVKWISFYSYNSEKAYILKVAGNEQIIKQFIANHSVIVGFNQDDFDIPILKNNNLWPIQMSKYFPSIDLQEVLCGKVGKPGKRGYLMSYKFSKQSLEEVAKVMKVEMQKSKIDHSIWKKDFWTTEEEAVIKDYCEHDILSTKQIFDKVYDFWLPFTTFISQRNVDNYSWITSSEGALAYRYACNVLGCEELYGDKGEKTDGGGRVLEPTVDEATNVCYIDVRSLYPHMYSMFNLLSERPTFTPGTWHGNEYFKVEGYYDISVPNKLCVDMMEKLKERVRLKKLDPKNPLVYVYKILLNSVYGANRSTVFTNLHTPNSGKDCCWLGRQMQMLIQSQVEQRGYKVIYGDTDSLFLVKPGGKIEYQEMRKVLDEIVAHINTIVPFQQPTFEIEIEAMIDYIMFSDDKEGEKNKKNYCYIKAPKVGSDKPKELIIMGLPIKKANATALAPLILEKYIKPRMLIENQGKFERSWIVGLVQLELKNDISLIAQEYNCDAFLSYGLSGRSCLYAQISKAYLDGQGGKIKLIKNKNIGKVGGGSKYCTIEEAKNLKIWDVELSKVYNELQPFCKVDLSGKQNMQVRGVF